MVGVPWGTKCSVFLIHPNNINLIRIGRAHTHTHTHTHIQFSFSCSFFYTVKLNCLTFKNRASYTQDRRIATLQMLHLIYIFFSTTISTEYFRHAAHSPFFSSKCRLFHNVTFSGSCIIHILHTGYAKI